MMGIQHGDVMEGGRWIGTVRMMNHVQNYFVDRRI
jgi:hypothetical protein